jgi:hypothetical protein
MMMMMMMVIMEEEEERTRVTNYIVTSAKYRNETKLFHILKAFSFGLGPVYSRQNYWIFGLLPSAGVLESRNTTFRKLDLFHPRTECSTPKNRGRQKKVKKIQ